MSYKSKVDTLKLELKDQVLSHFKHNNLEEIEFKRPIRIMVQESNTYDDDYVMVSNIATNLLNDGTITTDHIEINIGELDLYEIAYILDVLNNEEYNVVSIIDH